MKTFTKTLIVIAAVLLVIGAVASIVGMAMGGTLRLQYGWEDVTYTMENNAAPSGAIKSLDFMFEYGDVRIVRGDEFTVAGAGVETGVLESRMDGDTWKIVYMPPFRNYIWPRVNFGYSRNILITVTLPRDFVAQEVRLDVGAGKLSGEGLRCDTARLKVGAGYMTLADFESEHCTIECGVGAVDFEGVVRRTGRFECGVGRIGLKLQGDEKEYNYTIDVGLGHARINQNSYSGNVSQQVKNTEEDRSFAIKCGLGEIALGIGE